jgi:hypothetical protein
MDGLQNNKLDNPSDPATIQRQHPKPGQAGLESYDMGSGMVIPAT